MKSAAVCAAVLVLGRLALGAEEAESLAMQSELARVMQDLPRVPKVLHPGADGFPRMPPLEGVTANVEGAKRSLSMEAGRMASHLAKLEKDDQVEVEKHRTSLLQKLGDQEKKNQVFVSENAKLARNLFGLKKQTNLLKSQIVETGRKIRSRRLELAKFSTKFQEAQKFADRVLTNFEPDQEDAVQDVQQVNLVKEIHQDNPKEEDTLLEDESGLSFLELGMDKKKRKGHAKRHLQHHKSKEMNLVSEQQKVDLHIEGLSKEDEDAMTELLRGTQGVQGEASKAIQKIKEDYDISHQVGLKRLEALKKQQKVLRKSQAAEVAYAKKLKVSLRKLQKTSSSLDAAVSNQDDFVGNLQRTATNQLNLLGITAA